MICVVKRVCFAVQRLIRILDVGGRHSFHDFAIEC